MKNKFDKDNFTGKNHEGSRANLPVRFLTASSIIGDKVHNLAEEDLGTIKDIMLNVEMGTIEYVVIEMGGFLGLGEKYFAIPYQLLSLDDVNEAFILNQSKEILKNAPGFDKDHWPETNAHMETAYSYWGGFMGANTGSEPY